MTDISQDIQQTDIDRATTKNRAVLQERFPDLDLSVGGVVDSLIVDGNVLISAQNDADVDRSLLVTQLKSIAEGSTVIDDDDLDRLMANYYLERNQAVPASGSVAFVVRQDRTYVFQAGYRIWYGDQAYKVVGTYTVHPTSATGVNFSSAYNIRLTQVYDEETGYGYRFELPFESVEATPLAVRVSGDRFVVDQSFDGLGYAEASTNFAGGTAAETNEEFAARGLDGLLAYTLGGQDNLNKVVRTAVQQASAWGIGAGDPLMTRDRDNVFGISTGGKLDLYVKSGAVAQTSYRVDAEVVNVAARRLRITLTREQSAGVYRATTAAYYTSTPPTIVSGDVTVESVEHQAWTGSGFNPEMPNEIDRAFSARQQIVITFIDDRQDSGGYVVTLGAPGDTVSGAYVVATSYQPQLLDVDTLVSSDAVRPPGLDVLAKAAVPCITTVSVTAQRPADYNGPSAADLEYSLSSAINLLPISTTVLNTYTLGALLNELSPGLTVLSATLNATLWGQDDTERSLSQVNGGLTLPTDTLRKISPYNTYFTTTADRVSVSLV